ncbi:transposase [Streptomyces sp. cg2]|uniref:transposase n=1 Tax=Streptomyces sp. cg2 TaxID=3238799 RepID=UPI0034E2C769
MALRRRLEPGRTSWTVMLDVVRLRPCDDEIVTAGQVREVAQRLPAAGQRHTGDLPVLIVVDAGYDVTRLAFSPPTHQLNCWAGYVGTASCPPPATADRQARAQAKHGQEFTFAVWSLPGPPP